MRTFAGIIDLHYFGEAGDTKHIVHVIGSSGNGETRFACEFAVYQTQPQKSGGNVINAVEVKNKLRLLIILVLLFCEELVNSAFQRAFDFRTDFSVESAGKVTKQRIAGLGKFHSIENIRRVDIYTLIQIDCQ
jgi:hypothetical protein